MKKKKTQKNVNLQGRFISLPKLKEDFERAEAEEQEKAEAEAAKQAKRRLRMMNGSHRLSVTSKIRPSMLSQHSTARMIILHLQAHLEFLMMEQSKSSRLASRTTSQIQPMPMALRTLISQPSFMPKGKGMP